MRLSARLLVGAAFVVSLYAEQPQPALPGSPAKVVTAKPKTKHMRWLRRLCSAEVGLAMKLSSAGIPQPAASGL